MKKFYLEKVINDEAIITGEEFVHLKNVLRCEVGEKILCFIGDGKEYECKITEIASKFAKAKVLNIRSCKADPTKRITVYQGLPKGDKFEFLIQKLSEVGVSTLVPFESSFTIAKPKDKEERYQKLAKEACKQCGRSVPLTIEKSIKFKELLNIIKQHQVVYFAYEHALKGDFSGIENKNDIAIIVGSEGGFSEEENKLILEAGAKSVTLGKRILRCETACVIMAGLVSYLTNN